MLNSAQCEDHKQTNIDTLHIASHLFIAAKVLVKAMHILE